MHSSEIEHSGIVVEVLSGLIRVQILSEAACVSCHAKGACTASDMEHKIIDVTNVQDDFAVGDPVLITMFSSDGYRALFYAYIVPFLIVFLSLVICLFFFNELVSGLISLGLLVPYFASLYFLKDCLANKFNYMLKRL